MLKEYDKDRFDFNVNKRDGMRFYSATAGKLKFVDSCSMLKGSLSNFTTHHILNKGDLTIVKVLSDLELLPGVIPLCREHGRGGLRPLNHYLLAQLLFAFA